MKEGRGTDRRQSQRSIRQARPCPRLKFISRPLPWKSSFIRPRNPLRLNECQPIPTRSKRVCHPTLFALTVAESGGGPPHSRTLSRGLKHRNARSVLECASPLALFPKGELPARYRPHVAAEANRRVSAKHKLLAFSGRKVDQGRSRRGMEHVFGAPNCIRLTAFAIQNGEMICVL